jgi:uncharacterized protein YndB with AHSA1/START domain
MLRLSAPLQSSVDDSRQGMSRFPLLLEGGARTTAGRPLSTLREMYSTYISRHVNAPRVAVYRALLDADAIAKWRVPNGMRSHVHQFDPREGGAFLVSLTYEEPTGMGKSTAHTDTYHGYFAKLVPNEQVVEIIEFDSADAGLRGEMRMITTLADADGGTEVSIVHAGVPDSVPAADNETGMRMALDKLARLVET